MYVLHREKRSYSLDVLIGILADVYKNNFNFHSEAAEIESSQYNFFSIINHAGFQKFLSFRILRASPPFWAHGIVLAPSIPQQWFRHSTVRLGSIRFDLREEVMPPYLLPLGVFTLCMVRSIKINSSFKTIPLYTAYILYCILFICS